jgi:ribosomal protein S18 acetylase RimI-like enzyme
MNADVPAELVFRQMQLDDTESVVELGMSSLTYIDLAAADPELAHSPYLYMMGGLTYGDLATTDPDSPLAMSIVAEINYRKVGFILAYSHFVGIPITKICIIHAIVVDPSYHGQGIGTRLLNQLKKKCKEENIQIIRMFIKQHDTSLKTYLGSLGFHQSNVINYDILIE